MAATLKQISDAIIVKIAALSEFNVHTVLTFKGDIEEFLDRQTRNLPFCGVTLVSGDYPEEMRSTDNSLSREDISFQLTVIAEDFRGQKFSTEDAYVLLEALLSGLIGADLSLDGVAPVAIGGFIEDEDLADRGIAVYRMTIGTWQVRQ